MSKDLLFLDVESSGAGEEDRLIQVAYKYVFEGAFERWNKYFTTDVLIKAGAKAIHHITERDLQDKPRFIGSEDETRLKVLSERGYILVAHNAKFDLDMLKKEGVMFTDWIDTLKIARHIDNGQFENHTLQYLRYFYNLHVDLEGLSPHDALADIIVLEAVYEKLVGEIAVQYGLDGVTAIPKMIEISKQPNLLKICQFKKHKGELWEDVCKNDPSYIRYFDDKDVDEDTRFTMNHWMNR